MEFCSICNNMLYIKSNENKLIKYCKHCSFEKEEDNSKAIKISETIYTEDDLLFNQNINKYLRFDPTLPRIFDEKNKCTNINCDATSEQKQIIYKKYDHINMSYFYICDHCGFIWRLKK